ncbi:ABC transporter permease [Microbacterium sp. LWH11-1.2]|uniref:ABC transporter permease n=1 Tax=unclassified Microbacterium TaxID=2609290 RepID=UPI00313A1F7A
MMSTKTAHTPTAPSTTPRKSVLLRFRQAMDLQLVILVIATVLLMGGFTAASPMFFTADNLLNIANQNASTFIVAAAAGMLLMAGYVDMSVGSVMALAGVCAAFASIEYGMIAGIVCAVLVGTLVGTLNGVLIGQIGMSPIVVTLGVLAAARGLAQLLSPGSLYGLPVDLIGMGSGVFLGIPILVWIAGVICAIFWFVSARMPAGKHTLAVGANPRAAFLTGIPVKSFVMVLYIVVGISVGIAAIMQVARLGSAPSGTLGLGFEVAVLTAVLLGGVPFTGGRGSVIGVLIGVWLIAVLGNGLTLLNVPTEISGIVTGVVLVLAAASSLSGFQRRRRRPRRVQLSARTAAVRVSK